MRGRKLSCRNETRYRFISQEREEKRKSAAGNQQRAESGLMN